MKEKMIRTVAAFSAVLLLLMAFTVLVFAEETDAYTLPVVNYVLQFDPADPIADAKAAADKKTKTDEPAHPDGDFHVGFSLPEELYAALLSADGTLSAQIDFAIGEEEWLSEKNGSVPVTEELEIGKMFYSFYFGDVQAKAFRNLFPKKIFTQKTEKVKKAEIKAFYIDPAITIRTRVRLALTDGKDETRTTEWSEPFAFGKNADVLPGIAYLDYPTVSSCSLDVETKSATFYAEISGNIRSCEQRMKYYGFEEDVVPHLEYSVNGSEYIELPLTDFDPFISGEKTVEFPDGVLKEYSFLQMRIYYTADGGTVPGTEEPFSFRSDYSVPVTASAMPELETTVAEETTAEDPTAGQQTEKDEKPCPICGDCIQPLGICIYVWIIGILLIAVFVLFAMMIHFLAAKKRCPRCDKGCKKNTAVCPECGFRFTSVLPLVEEDEKKPANRKRRGSDLFVDSDESESGTKAPSHEPFTDLDERIPHYRSGESIEKRKSPEETEPEEHPGENTQE